MKTDFKISMKAARVNKGLTLKEAAKRLGVSLATLKNYESGKTSPQWKTIDAMEQLYCIPIDYIFFDAS